MSALGNKEIMAKNIRYYLDKNELKASELCKLLNFPMATFSDWIHAKSYPRIDKIELMANYFGITKSDLVEEKSSIQAVPIEAGFKIPVMGRVAAGYGKEAIEEVIDEIEISPKLAAKGEFFGLVIKGDSMVPDLKNGDTVIVQRMSDTESGDLVIALVNGSDATCKRLQKYAEGFALIPNNPMYEPIRFTKEEAASTLVRILGKVVELRRKF